MRVLELVEAVLREPFAGIGKPEPLKHLLSGVWSRRVTEEHRLVYLVQGERWIFFSHATTTDRSGSAPPAIAADSRRRVSPMV